MEDFSKQLLIAVKEYYIQDETDKESLELVADIMRFLYCTTNSWKLKGEIENYLEENNV